MDQNFKRCNTSGLKRCLAFVLALMMGAMLQGRAHAFTVNVMDENGAPVTGFKWLLEQDNTHPPEPGVHKAVDPLDVNNNTLSISLHRSHAPVVASGESAPDSASATIDTTASGAPLPAGRYFVSVLPFGTGGVTYDMGGAPIDTSTQAIVTVYVRTAPIETAQVSIKVFHDIRPLNNAPDIGEPGLAGFTVTLTDQGGDIVQDVFGNPLCGTGDCVTDANGEVIIKNLAPNKYGIQVEPPAGQGWIQTTTIEGTPTIDAWVRPNEPPFLVEFGPPFWHAFYGFVKEFNNLAGLGSTVTGQVRKGHLSRPPDITFFPGPPPEGEAIGERCIVGLNRLEQGFAEALFVGKCEDGTGIFTIPNVPDGNYQLVIWDVSLLHIISFNTVSVQGGSVDLGPVTTPMWFGQQEHYVLFDGTDTGIPEQNVNLRFRDGTIYQAFPTDTTGFVPFQSVFPFFHWLVAEVDFARHKATGVRITNDLGGPVDDGPDGEGKRNPSVDIQNGPVLTQAFQVFAGQNQRFEWFKENYGPGENGGISGIIFYATTRAEDDPRLAAGEPWEPGIPRVQVNLYKDLVCNSNGGPAVFPLCPEATAGEVGDGIPDPQDPAATFPYAPVYPDVDNYPQGNFPGPEDLDRNANTTFDLGDALRVTYTDSWDDSLPEGCNGAATPLNIHGQPVPISQCAEGLRTWNQARPGVFDGGYAFGPNVTGDGSPELPAGTYIVEAVTPPGYKLVKEEDRNVDFGPTPIPAILPPRCVGLNPDGTRHTVPPYMSFVTRGDGTLLDWADPVEHAAPFAGEERFLCSAKKVDLGTGQNAAADFFLFTDVPRAARAVGIITDDLANELAPGKPQFTEKFSPPWISIAVFDYTGKEIFRTYGDEFGAYNWLAPSTYAINLPTPSGVGPKMHQFCLNHPGPIPNPAFNPDDPEGPEPATIIDPRFRPQYSTTCYTFNFEPGRTTYLDTPVIRQAAFVGALQQTLDCELPARTPVIQDVINRSTGEPAVARTGQQIEIRSMGRFAEVRNPAFPGDQNNDGIPDDPPTEPEFITRDFSFQQDPGDDVAQSNKVCVDDPTTDGLDFCFPGEAITLWNRNRIRINIRQADINAGLRTGQLSVTTRFGVRTEVGLTLTVNPTEAIRQVPSQYPTIQAAIDAAGDGDLILVAPGTYRELPIVYKRVKLQGAGAGSTTIWASHFSAGPGFDNPLVAWREKLSELVTAGQIGLLPEQDPSQPDFFFKDGEGPGIFVAPLPGRFGFTGNREDLSQRARIDGFRIMLADLGGGVYVNANGRRLQISNNRFTANAGNLGGGIRVGNPTAVAFALGGVAVENSPNQELDIRHNQIDQNGSLRMGGGISIFKGADRYRIDDNWMCGNFARSGGGAIAHRGLSDNGRMEMNHILFNEVFQGDQPGAGLGIGGGGGGIELAGDPDPAGGLTEGTGQVLINRNLIQGNLGGSADGGGIALNNINGQDAAAGDPHLIQIYNNLIVNNVSGLGGGGISLQDAINVRIRHNTIARNDSTATSVFAGIGAPPSVPQPAGIVSRAHSTGLAAVTGQTFSSPDPFNRNIFWQNRSFYWDPNAAPNLQPNPAGSFWDLGVVGAGAAACLDPAQSLLTELVSPSDPACNYTGSGNLTGDPRFAGSYFNSLTSAAAADEGGNFVQVYYTPLGLTGDYHLSPGSAAFDAGPFGAGGLLETDFDGDPRPLLPGTRVDLGGDECVLCSGF